MNETMKITVVITRSVPQLDMVLLLMSCVGALTSSTKFVFYSLTFATLNCQLFNI
jgi:hypothetical protein